MCVTEFESQEKKRQQEELDAYNKHLDDEMEREKNRHQRNLEALSKRKEDMIKEKKNKLKVCWACSGTCESGLLNLRST